MKKFLSLLAVSIFIVGFSSCSENDLIDSIETKSIPTIETKELKADIQYQANMLNAKILSTFTSKTRESNEVMYPEYYGGSYITPEGKLIIFIKGDITTGRNNITSITNDSQIIYKPCRYSFQELTDIVNSIGDYLKNNLIIKKNTFSYL